MKKASHLEPEQRPKAAKHGHDEQRLSHVSCTRKSKVTGSTTTAFARVPTGDDRNLAAFAASGVGGMRLQPRHAQNLKRQL